MIINKKCCPTCGQTINEREIVLFSGMVEALWIVFRRCEDRGKYTFTRKEIKHLLSGDNQRARFGDWIMFGGIVYRPGGIRGHYGIDREKAIKFFANELQIPTRIWKNPVTKETTKEDYKYLEEIKNISSFLDSNREFIVEYRDPQMSFV